MLRTRLVLPVTAYGFPHHLNAVYGAWHQTGMLQDTD